MKKTLIIAEAGVNHNGDFALAKNLVSEAASAGADIIKFQTFKSDQIATEFAKKTNYQIENTKSSSNQKDMLRELELTDQNFLDLYQHCKQNNIEFLSTAFDSECLEMLIKVGLKRIKIPSGEITNLPYLRKVASYNLPVIISTGMSNIGEIDNALEILLKNGVTRKNLTILHCTSEYPASFKSINLKAMNSIKNTFGVNVGYSDHSIGIEVSIAAVTLGAKIIEKHFTLDKKSPGPDHKASLEPFEFKKMVDSIRNIEQSLGDGIKKPSEIEIENSFAVRKSIVASKYINKGDIFSEHNLTTKRPYNGLSPMLWDKVIGSKAKRNYSPDENID